MKERSVLSRLMVYAGGYRWLTRASWGLAAFSALLGLTPFVCIWKISAAALGNGTVAEMRYWGWTAVSSAALALLVYIAALMCSHLAAFRVASNIRTSVMHHIARLPLGSAEAFGTGKLRSIVNECAAATENYLAHQLPDLSATLAVTAGTLFLLLFFDWRLGVLSLLPSALAALTLRSMIGPDMAKRMEEYRGAIKDLENETVEYIRGIPVVKTFGQSVFSFRRFRDTIARYEKLVLGYTYSMRPYMILFTTLVQSVFVFLLFGGLWLARGSSSPELLQNMFFYIVISPAIAVNFHKIMFSAENKMTVVDALRRIDSVLSLAPAPQPRRSLRPRDASIELRDVTFSYGDRKAVDAVSLRVEAGQTAALAGPSGGGKSTLAHLIARFFDPQRGQVFIGGVDVRDIAKEDLMDFVSFVFQDSRLIKASIFDNVRMGRPGATREEALAALHAAQCDDILDKLPQGAETVIGAKGVYLSGGELQRLAIARAMLKDAPILILDEATAFADPDNESRIQTALSQLSQGKTVVMIAHRLSSIRRADVIFVMENGRLREKGTFDELTAGNSLFARLWRTSTRTAAWSVAQEAASC